MTTSRDAKSATTTDDSANAPGTGGPRDVGKRDRESEGSDRATKRRDDSNGTSEGQNDGSKEEQEAEEVSGQRP